ncbi:hypothetical protein FGB62_260g010 [Gracilaria domingensis]|nr:hypothetical protein FGB62_260g010 [Gracilaria domingensis]
MRPCTPRSGDLVDGNSDCKYALLNSHNSQDSCEAGQSMPVDEKCFCAPDLEAPFCAHFDVLDSELNACAESANCPTLSAGECAQACLVEAYRKAGVACRSNATPSQAPEQLDTPQEPGNEVDVAPPVKKPDQVDAPEEPGTIADDAPCVETEWLKQNGFTSGILREYGVTKTLCLNGLPCGTDGHLLRECSASAQCSLITYKEICKRKRECKVKYTSVSRISHNVNWSAVQAEECDEDGNTVSLTSLSIDVEGPYMWPSYLIARIGEIAIAQGFGRVVDVIVLTWTDLTKNYDNILGAMVRHGCK